MMALPACLGLAFKPSAGGGGSTYVNSVQQVSVVIAAGASSGTATISSVGSNAFILFGGFQTETAANYAQGTPRVELTNATTVTAYRNTSSGSNSVTVKVSVVDPTGSLVASVAAGTVSVSSGNTSGTATVGFSADSYTVVAYLGVTTDSTSNSFKRTFPILSISGTTVTASRQDGSSDNLTVGFVVVKFQSAACNQTVQFYNKSWTNSGTSATQTITSVNVNNAMLVYAGQNANVSANMAQASQYGSLTNGTTVTVQTNTAGSVSCNYNFFVVEFASGVLKSNAQTGTTTLTAATSNTSSISSVTTSLAALHFLGGTSTTTNGNLNTSCASAALTASTTVSVTKNGSSNNVTDAWQVTEFN